MLVTEPLEKRIEKMRDQVDELRKWNGNDSPSVRTGELMIAEFEDAMRDAAEAWLPTREAAEVTDWEAATLTKWARAKLAGEKVPFAWRSLQVRKDPNGYSFRVSSIPTKAKKSA